MTLEQRHWHPYNHRALVDLIERAKHAGNYVVFDWDYTCIFNDTQNALFLYQIDHLLFKVTPDEFRRVLRYHFPDIDIKTAFQNEQGEFLTPAMLADDLEELYSYLYANYEGLGGARPMEEIRTTQQFHDFKVLMHYYTRVMYRHSLHDFTQITSAGFDLPSYREMVQQSIDDSLACSLQADSFCSSPNGKSKSVSASWRYGTRMREEVKELFRVFRDNGIDIYIVSASQEENVRVFASDKKYGYGVAEDHVFGGRREFLDGKFTIKDDKRYVPTYREGKTRVIEKIFVEKHGRPPLLIAGDSDGDVHMMNTFKDRATLLIFNRNLENAQINELVKQGIRERDCNDNGNGGEQGGTSDDRKNDCRILVQDFFLGEIL